MEAYLQGFLTYRTGWRRMFCNELRPLKFRLNGSCILRTGALGGPQIRSVYMEKENVFCSLGNRSHYPRRYIDWTSRLTDGKRNASCIDEDYVEPPYFSWIHAYCCKFSRMHLLQLGGQTGVWNTSCSMTPVEMHDISMKPRKKLSPAAMFLKFF